MNNDLIVQKSWWKLNWKWFVPIIGIVLLSLYSLFSSGFSGILGNYSKAYADSELYDLAVEKVRLNNRVKEVLGEVEPIGPMTILNGSVNYSEDNTSVNTTIKITCKNGKAMLDISANRVNETWYNTKITIRIKNPPEKKATINVLTL